MVFQRASRRPCASPAQAAILRHEIVVLPSLPMNVPDDKSPAHPAWPMSDIVFPIFCGTFGAGGIPHIHFFTDVLLFGIRFKISAPFPCYHQTGLHTPCIKISRLTSRSPHPGYPCHQPDRYPDRSGQIVEVIVNMIF